MGNEKRTLSVMEMATQVGIGKNKAYEWVRTGGIRSIKIGRRVLIPKDAVDELLKGTNGTSTERESV